MLSGNLGRKYIYNLFTCVVFSKQCVYFWLIHLTFMLFIYPPIIFSFVKILQFVSVNRFGDCRNEGFVLDRPCYFPFQITIFGWAQNTTVWNTSFLFVRVRKCFCRYKHKTFLTDLVQMYLSWCAIFQSVSLVIQLINSPYITKHLLLLTYAISFCIHKMVIIILYILELT